MCNNLKLEQVNINASAKFGLMPSVPSQDIERKQNSDKIIKGHNCVVNL